MSISVDFKATDGFSFVVFKFERVKELRELLIFKMNTSLQKGVPEVGDVDLLLFVELQDVVHEHLLCTAHSGHHVGRNKSS